MRVTQKVEGFPDVFTYHESRITPAPLIKVLHSVLADDKQKQRL